MVRQIGVDNAVATLGTAVTTEHCQQLKALTRRVVTVFDADAAGNEAWQRSVHLFLELGIFAKDLSLPPGKDSQTAMEAGMYWAVLGGIEMLIRQYEHPLFAGLDVFLTGGDAVLLRSEIHWEYQLWPEMTLEGLRLAAEALP